MERSELLVAMDACRAQSDDLELPELAPVAEQVAADPAARRAFDLLQRLDRRMSVAIHDLPVPPGLAERILGRIQAASTGDAAANSADAATNSADAAAGDLKPGGVSPRIGQPSHRVRRQSTWRKSTWAFVAVAASVVVAVSLSFWPRPAALTLDHLLGASGDWATQLWEQGTNWTKLPADHQRGVPHYPLADAVRAIAVRSADARRLVGTDAMAYDLGLSGRRRAMLFVIPQSDFVADSTPPINPQSSTAGLMIGCWQTREWVYILVVDGDERNYKNLLRSIPPPPFA